MRQATTIKSSKALHALFGVLETGNAMSRCHAIRAIERLKPVDAKLERRLIDLLGDPDPDVRTDIAVALGNLEIGEATAPLLDTLRKDHDGEVRIQAVIALSKIKSRDAVEPLIECFKADGYPELDYLVDDLEFSPCWEVQSQAMEALGQIRDHRATQPLIEVFESGQYDDLQERGFKVLAHLNADQARAFLIRQLSHDSPRTRRRAAQALGSLLNGKGEKRNPPQEILDTLLGVLADSDADVRMSAARALAGIDNPVIEAALVKLISDPDAEVRVAAAAILGKITSPEILERLHGFLEEQDWKLRRSVVCILGQIGDGRSQEPLTALLDTQDEDLLHEVLRSLGLIGTSGPERRLAEILSAQQTHSAIRIQAAQALGNILGDRSSPTEREEAALRIDPGNQEEAGKNDNRRLNPKHVLAATVFDENEQLGCVSLTALVNAYPDEAVAWLSDILHGQPLILLREEYTTAGLATASPVQQVDPEDDTGYSLLIGDDPETSTLASFLAGLPGAGPAPKSEEDSLKDAPVPDRSAGQLIRIFAARLLGGVAKPGTPGVDALIKALRNADQALSREAVVALGRIGDEAALPVVIEALDSQHPEVRLAAVDVLKGFHLPSNAQVRIDALCTDPDPNLRCAAISALGSGSSVARDCLWRALQDENQQVCRTALNTLTKDTCSERNAERIFALIFRFSGELRKEAGAALRRVGDLPGVSRLLGILRDTEQEELHWLCIDALAEYFAGAAHTAEGQ